MKNILNYYFSDDWKNPIVIYIGILFASLIFIPFPIFVLKFHVMMIPFSALIVYVLLKPIYNFIANHKVTNKIYSNTYQEKHPANPSPLETIARNFLFIIIWAGKISFFIACFILVMQINIGLGYSGRYLTMKYQDIPHYVAFPCSYYDYGNYEESNFPQLSDKQLKEIDRYYRIRTNWDKPIDDYCSSTDYEDYESEFQEGLY